MRIDTTHSRVRETARPRSPRAGGPGAGFSTRVFGITSQKDGLDYPIPAGWHRELNPDDFLTREALSNRAMPANGRGRNRTRPSVVTRYASPHSTTPSTQEEGRGACVVDYSLHRLPQPRHSKICLLPHTSLSSVARTRRRAFSLPQEQLVNVPHPLFITLWALYQFECARA